MRKREGEGELVYTSIKMRITTMFLEESQKYMTKTPKLTHQYNNNTT